MTGKERILSAISGERSDRIPFVPNIWQWFYARQLKGTLPPPVSKCQHPIEALRIIGADVLSKFEGKAQSVAFRNCELRTEFLGGEIGRPLVWAGFTTFEGRTRRRESLQTPLGNLSHEWEYQTEAGTAFEKEHWWKDWSEFDVVRYWLKNSEFRLDLTSLMRGLSLVGDDGIVLFQLLETPLKKFHWLAGQETATYFICDHPAEMRELARIHELKALEFLEEVVDLPSIQVFEVPDNLDSLFYTPGWFREYCMSVLRKQAMMIHARGKYLFVHACGRLKALAPLFVECGIDSLEGQAAPPVGDWSFPEARAASDRLVLCGGMAAPQQELFEPDADLKIKKFVRELLGSLPHTRRFLFGSSCNTSPLTPYENLLAFRDADFEWQAV